jgi:hypothetical protein
VASARIHQRNQKLGPGFPYHRLNPLAESVAEKMANDGFCAFAAVFAASTTSEKPG